MDHNTAKKRRRLGSQSVKSSSLKSIKKRRELFQNTMKYALKHQSKVPTYDIPKEKFQHALEMLENKSKFPVSVVAGYQIRCTPNSYEIGTRKIETRKGSIIKLLHEARKCLLKRDWINLAKILCLAIPKDDNSYIHHFGVLKKYAEICLAHNPDKELLDNFKRAVLHQNENFDHIDDIKFRKIIAEINDKQEDKNETNDEINKSTIIKDNGNGNGGSGLEKIECNESDDDDDDDSDDDDDDLNDSDDDDDHNKSNDDNPRESVDVDDDDYDYKQIHIKKYKMETSSDDEDNIGDTKYIKIEYSEY